MIIQSPRKFVECSYCDVIPPPILHVTSRLIESTCHIHFMQSYKLHSCIHTSIHQYFHVFIHSCIHTSIHQYFHVFIHSCIHNIYTTSFIHDCISHPESCLAVSLQSVPQSSQVASSNKRTTYNSHCPSKVSSPVCLVKRCHPSSMSSSKF